MPEYLAPGVYVEETSFRPKSIEGVGTSTTAFVGPTRKGPLTATPEVITSFGEFARIYGGLGNLSFASGNDANPNVTNYIAHGVRAFFNNGGSRLYIARAFVPRGGDGGAGIAQSQALASSGADEVRLVAMNPGSGYNGSVTFIENRIPATRVSLAAAPEGSLLATDPEGTPAYFVGSGTAWAADDDTTFDPTANSLPAMQLITLTVEVTDADGNSLVYDNIGLDPAHPRYLGAILAETPSRKADLLQNPYYLSVTGNFSAIALREALFIDAENNPLTAVTVEVRGGHDGAQPSTSSDADSAVTYTDALALLEDVEEISILAAPGYSAFAGAASIQNALIVHAENMQYRIAVLDSEEGLSVAEALEARSAVDSTRAAFYYPWVVVENPSARPGNALIPKEIALPPSGFVAGIYARTDSNRGVWKAPANEPVLGALRFEQEINHAQQEVLNPNGVNCLRSFFGRGNRVWGARTASSDPEWKYVNVRRYFIYLERSIDRSTQWAVFEPNGERLWANIRETVSNFLYAEWRNGALLGSTPEEAFFVKCDRSTMTQNDLDNGRLICEIGVAVLYPAEFVIFRIGQKTADARA